ncbi:MAG: ROK family protein [Lachnospiraceae bacterium]|nr:ROK family protein [Lachnospiraceae bacterium]
MIGAHDGKRLIGALEAGGTKMICAIGSEDGTILERYSVPTRSPEETMPEILGWFLEHKPAALGIASFGPVDPDPASESYGHITTTPKPGWADYDLLGTIKKVLPVPMGFDTDVNGSLLGEVSYGGSRGLNDVVYITVGTGIGGGVMSGGKLLHGMLHPELGHMLMRPHPSDSYAGKCPFHGQCLEGLASGPAIEERWGLPGEKLSDRPEVWELEAYYLGQAIVNLILCLSPKRIILGGGVMHQTQLFPLIRREVSTKLNGYIRTKELSDPDSYIVAASLKDDQGILGCIKLALNAMSFQS